MQSVYMAPYFPQVVSLNGSNADTGSDVTGPSSISSGDLFELSDWSRFRPFTISPTTNNTGRHLAFERDFNFHHAFRKVLRHYL